MKKIIALLIAGLVFSVSQVYAGNGDLIVNGNLGVGTASPGSDMAWGLPTVDISGIRGSLVLRTTSASGISSLRFKGPAVSDDWGVNMYAGLGTSNGYLGFLPQGGLVTGLVVNKLGNVGIGTTSPGADMPWGIPTLDISGARGSLVLRTTNPSGISSLRFKGPDVLDDWAFNMYAGPGTSGYYGIFPQAGVVTGLIMTKLGNVGIGAYPNPSYALDVTGYAHTQYGVWSGSDINLKKNLLPVTDALSKILQLSGFSYEWKTDMYSEANSPEINSQESLENKVKALEHKNNQIPKGRHFGVIAQDVEKILPEVVNTGSDGIKAVAYNEIIPFLIEAIKEQQLEINQLKKQLLSQK